MSCRPRAEAITLTDADVLGTLQEAAEERKEMAKAICSSTVVL